MTTKFLYKVGDVKRLIKIGLFIIISLAVYIISSHTHANSIEFDENILAGFPGITGNISHAHFNYGGNNFYGTFFRLSPIDTGNTTISQAGASDKICKKQIRGLYYNNERGYRLWPLDNQTLATLKGIDPAYNNLVLLGGLYTLCSGSNPDEVYGQVVHNRYNGTTFYLTVGVNQDFTNNIYTGGRSGNFKFLNNTTGYFRDNRGGIASIWGTGVPAITQTGACTGVVTSGAYYNGTTSYIITQSRNGSTWSPITAGTYTGSPAQNSCNFNCIAGYQRSGAINQCKLVIGTFCGDGIVQTPNSGGISEECDYGDTTPGDGCSATCQRETPSCTITTTPNSGPVPLTVTFSGTKNIRANYTLNFGNGSSTGNFTLPLNKIYSNTGTFVYSFTGYFASGNKSCINTGIITVNNVIDTTAPTCTISYNPNTATSGNVLATCTPSETVTFQNPSGTGIYTFTGNGSFIFNFTDTAGNTGTATATVTWIDKIAPVITQVTAVPTPTNDTTPDYTFSSTESGTITYGGSCSSSTTNAGIGNNTITFNTLANGTYSNCTITLTDSLGNQSNVLTVNTFIVNNTIPDTTAPTCTISYSPNTATSGNVLATCTPSETVTFQNPSGTGIYTFTGNGSFIFNFTDTAGNTGTATATVTWIDKIAPVIAQITAVPTPTNDTTPDYTFSSTESGTITYGGSCSSSTTNAGIGNNTITFNTLANGTYSNCTITVTDSLGNQSNILTVNTFIVNLVTCRSGRTNQNGTCVLTATGNTIITGTINSGSTITIPGNITIYSSGSNTGGYLQISGVNSIGISYNNRNGIIIPPTIFTAGSCAVSTNTLMSISSGLTNPVVLLEFQAGASGSTITSNTTGGYFTIKVKVNPGTIGNTYRVFRSTQCGTGREKVYVDETCILDSNKMCEFRTNKLSYFNIVSNNVYSGGMGTPMIIGTLPRIRNAQIDKAYMSDPFTIANFNDVTFATVSKGMLYVNGEPVGTGGYVKNGDELNIEVYSSKKYDTTVSSKITVGSVSATFYITTLLEGDDNSADLSNLQKIRVMSIFNLLIDLYGDDASKEEQFLYTLRSMLNDKLDSIDTDDDAYSTFEYLLSLVEARLLTSGIDESNHIAPTCKEYKVSFEKEKNAYYSPDFKKVQYFSTRESLIRYIDSKNPGDCRINTYGSNYVDTTNTDPDKHISPNGKVYDIENNNGGYTSPDLSSTKYFDTLQALRAYLNINNPSIMIRNHEIDSSFDPINYIAPNGKVYKIYKTNKGYMSYKLVKVRYFTTLESIKSFINKNNKI